MVNKVFTAYLIVDLLLALCGSSLLAISLFLRSRLFESSTGDSSGIDNVAELLLISNYPLNISTANAFLTLIAFLLSIPAMLSREKRTMFVAHGWVVVLSSLFTLCLGLYMWFGTLTSRSMAGKMWGKQGSSVRSLLQQKWDCCGYFDSMDPPFEIDATCPTFLIAAQKKGCVGPFSSFVNKYLDIIIGSLFGIVGVHAALLLCIAMVLKDRKERERYRLIDAKNGIGSI